MTNDSSQSINSNQYENNGWIKIDKSLLKNQVLNFIIGNSGEWTSTKAVYPQSKVVHIADSPESVLKKITELAEKLYELAPVKLAPIKSSYDQSKYVKKAYPAYVFETGPQHDKIVEFKRIASDPKTTANVVQELSDLADGVKTPEGTKQVCDIFNKKRMWYEQKRDEP